MADECTDRQPPAERNWELLDEPTSGSRTAVREGSWKPQPVPRIRPRFTAADRRVGLVLAGLLAFVAVCGLTLPGLMGTTHPDYRAACASLPIEPVRALLGPDARAEGFSASTFHWQCGFASTSNAGFSSLTLTARYDRDDSHLEGAEPVEVAGTDRAGLVIDDSWAALWTLTDAIAYDIDLQGPVVSQPLSAQDLLAVGNAWVPRLTELGISQRDVRDAAGDPCRDVIARPVESAFDRPVVVSGIWQEVGTSSCTVYDALTVEPLTEITWDRDPAREVYDAALRPLPTDAPGLRGPYEGSSIPRADVRSPTATVSRWASPSRTGSSAMAGCRRR
ncbi:hypothetical protein ACF3NT_09010 [Naumannella halotolerans]|uniref:hypothetical protein n=1 Tax=Naumannella halotolerans TaxID=993414 RepID=UPI00370D7A81